MYGLENKKDKWPRMWIFGMKVDDWNFFSRVFLGGDVCGTTIFGNKESFETLQELTFYGLLFWIPSLSTSRYVRMELTVRILLDV
jgi:hypothetical protein